jgi:hypothetical protein
MPLFHFAHSVRSSVDCLHSLLAVLLVLPASASRGMQAFPAPPNRVASFAMTANAEVAADSVISDDCS